MKLKRRVEQKAGMPTSRSFSSGTGGLPKIDDRQFANLFSLFSKAMAHEIGNSLTAIKLGAQATKNTELLETITKLQSAYDRTGFLHQLATNDSHSFHFSAMVFSLEERERLGFKVDGNSVSADISSIREMGLEEVRKFRSNLLTLGSLQTQNEAYKSNINTLLTLGPLVATCLEKLMLGSLDLDAELINMKPEKIISTGDHNECKTKVSFSTSQTKEIEVLCNPIFSALVVSNIYSNARRAMKQVGANLEMEILVYRRGDVLVFEYTDQGCGMTLDMAKKLNLGVQFTTKSPKEPGKHGIAFNYCRELAEKMGGKLYVKGTIMGVGTCVALELKIAD